MLVEHVTLHMLLFTLKCNQHDTNKPEHLSWCHWRDLFVWHAAHCMATIEARKYGLDKVGTGSALKREITKEVYTIRHRLDATQTHRH